MITQFLVLLAGGLGVAYTLDVWAGHETPILLILAAFGSFISYIYSAPPLKLKQSGWSGNYALGASYIALPWWAGQVGARAAGGGGGGGALTRGEGGRSPLHCPDAALLPVPQALFGELSVDVMVLTVLYSLAGLGIAIVNDFKSIEGDRAMGLESLPVAFGVDTAK